MQDCLLANWHFKIPVLVALLASAQPGTAQQADPHVPPGVLEAAESIVVNARFVDGVWPGFWIRPRPYVILDFARQDVAVLVSPGDPLDGYARVPDSELPPALRGQVYVRGAGFDTDFLSSAGALPDERTPAPVPLVSPLLPGYTQTEIILHETFHLWQRATWKDHHRRPPVDCTPQRYEGVGAELPPDFDAAVSRELTYLARALAAPDDERAATVRAFLDVRLQRLLAADPLFIAVDQRQERVEGTAEFTGLAGTIATLHPDAMEARQALQDSLMLRLGQLDRRADEMQLDPSRRAAMRAYYGGAAMAFLLDRLGVDGWRNDIEQGDFLDVVLARHLGDAPYLVRVEEHGRPRGC